MPTHIRLPKPIGKYPYFDKVKFWVRIPLNRDELAVLERECGPAGIHIENRPAGLNNHRRQFRQKVELCRPSRRALRLLARRSDVLINRVEIASI
jgi:hypothetical protein